jgi:hypothetical protein
LYLEGEKDEERHQERRNSLCIEENRMFYRLYQKVSCDGRTGNNFLSWKLLIINDDVAYKRMIKCTNVVQLKNIFHLFEALGKCKNKINKI